jgi:hypothetical protein
MKVNDPNLNPIAMRFKREKLIRRKGEKGSFVWIFSTFRVTLNGEYRLECSEIVDQVVELIPGVEFQVATQ